MVARKTTRKPAKKVAKKVKKAPRKKVVEYPDFQSGLGFANLGICKKCACFVLPEGADRHEKVCAKW